MNNPIFWAMRLRLEYARQCTFMYSGAFIAQNIVCSVYRFRDEFKHALVNNTTKVAA